MSTTLQLKNRKRKDNSVGKKMAKAMNGQFTEETQMAINIHKSSSTSLVAWEMEIKT